jgi:hypothetical protein
MHSRTSSIVDVRKGNTPSSNIRTCDTVRAGALFPQAPLQVPQQEGRQHRRQHMMVPTGGCAPCIVGHPQCRFPCFEALRDRPPQTTSPAKGASGRARGGMTDVVSLGRFRAQGAFEHEPDRALRQAVLAACHALTGKRRHDRPLGPFRDRAPIPAGGRQTRCQGRHRARRLDWGHHDTLRVHFPLLSGSVLRGPRRLEPAAGVRRNGDARRDAETRVHGVQKVGAMAREASRHKRLARQEPLRRDGLHHRRCPRRVALHSQRVRDVARRPPGGIRVGQPRLRQAYPFVHQGIAMS